jgi:hypothetical protein
MVCWDDHPGANAMIKGHSCDRCHAMIPEHRTLIHVMTGPLRDQFMPAIDLCVDCASKLAVWLTGETSPRVAAPVVRR